MILAVWFRPLERERESPFSSLKMHNVQSQSSFSCRSSQCERLCASTHRTGPAEDGQDRRKRGWKKEPRWQLSVATTRDTIEELSKPNETAGRIGFEPRWARGGERREKISKWIGNQPSVIKRQTLKCRPAAARLIVWVTAIRRQLFSPHRPENWISIWELIQKHFTCAAPAGHSRCLAAMTSPIWQLSSYSQSSSLIPSREMKLSSSGVGLQRRSFTHTNSSKKRVENI